MQRDRLSSYFHTSAEACIHMYTHVDTHTLLSIHTRILFFLNGVSLYVLMCASCVPGDSGGQKVSDLLWLELQLVVSRHVGARNQTQVLSLQRQPVFLTSALKQAISTYTHKNIFFKWYNFQLGSGASQHSGGREFLWVEKRSQRNPVSKKEKKVT